VGQTGDLVLDIGVGNNSQRDRKQILVGQPAQKGRGLLERQADVDQAELMFDEEFGDITPPVPCGRRIGGEWPRHVQKSRTSVWKWLPACREVAGIDQTSQTFIGARLGREESEAYQLLTGDDSESHDLSHD